MYYVSKRNQRIDTGNWLATSIRGASQHLRVPYANLPISPFRLNAMQSRRMIPEYKDNLPPPSRKSSTTSSAS